jgi:Rrf2 family protein
MLVGARLANGVRALYELALLPERRSAVWELARKIGVSEPFLRRILLDLRAKGFVEAQKGRVGGFRLVKDPQNIKIRDLMGILEKSPVLALGRVQRNLTAVDESCPTYPFWKELEGKFLNALGEKTLADVIAVAQPVPETPPKRVRKSAKRARTTKKARRASAKRKRR